MERETVHDRQKVDILVIFVHRLVFLIIFKPSGHIRRQMLSFVHLENCLSIKASFGQLEDKYSRGKSERRVAKA